MMNKFSIEEVIPRSGFLSPTPCFFKIESRFRRIKGVIAGFLIFIMSFSVVVPVYAEDTLETPSDTTEITSDESSLNEDEPIPELTEMEGTIETEEDQTEITPAASPEASLSPRSSESGAGAPEEPKPSPNPSPGPSLENMDDTAGITVNATESTPQPSPSHTPSASDGTAESTPEPSVEHSPAASPEASLALEEREPTPQPSPEASAGIAEVTPEPTPKTTPTPEASLAPEEREPSPEASTEEDLLREQIRQEILTELAKQAEEQKAIDLSNKVKENDFSDSDCFKLSESEMYCLKANLKNVSKLSSAYVGAYVASDGNDNEIMFQRGGRVIQISDNSTDDVLPAYDEKSNIIVWQSLIDDRWQIMIYDFREGSTYQLTQSHGNSLNPGINNGLIVWQEWADNNWEIIMAVRDYQVLAGPDDKIEAVPVWTMSAITDNHWHDINPKIVNDFILWESLKDNNWHVFSYSLTTKNTEQLSSGLGKNTNPRLAVLWESEEGGIVKTLQYDINTQEISTITTKSSNGFGEQEIPQPPNQEKEATLPTPSTSSSSFSQQRDNDEE